MVECDKCCIGDECKKNSKDLGSYLYEFDRGTVQIDEFGDMLISITDMYGTGKIVDLEPERAKLLAQAILTALYELK